MRRLLAVLTTCLAGPATAATVTDVAGVPADYQITSVDLFSEGTGGTNDPSGKSYAGVQVNLSYGADSLIPFDSHGGFAAVTGAGAFFDITLTLTSFDDDPANNWDQLYIVLNVLNDSALAWSDFHVESYDASFTQPLGLTLLQVGSGTTTYPYFSNALFDQSSTYGDFGGAEFHFWSDTVSQVPTQSNQIGLRWDWGNPGDPYAVGNTIGIRVIATVPEPQTAMLLGLGLASTAAWARRARSRSTGPRAWRSRATPSGYQPSKSEPSYQSQSR